MKVLLITVLALLLGGCSVTRVSYDASGKNSDCPPVISVQSFGSNVSVSDVSECRIKK